MKTKALLVTVAILIALGAAGCGGGKSGTVSAMWPDVPTLPDSEKSDIKLPLPIRLIMQTAVKASASDNDVDLDKFDVVGYTTSHSPQEVAEFYSQDRMSEAGWNQSDQPGCMSGSDGQGMGGGGFCIFGRDDGAKQSILFIATAQDAGKNDTQVFYARFDGQLKGQ
jgi:hypothetical protein